MHEIKELLDLFFDNLLEEIKNLLKGPVSINAIFPIVK